MVLPIWGLKLLAIFIPIMREMPEMMYQFDRTYNCDFSKFLTRFKFNPTSNFDAVKFTVESLRKNVSL